MTDDDELGPIDYLVIEFPNGNVTTGGFEDLLDLAEQGVLRILDVEFVAKDGAGVRTVAPESLDGADLSAWTGASSGLLAADDLDALNGELSDGAVAVVIVYENRWTLALANRWRAEGARLVADGGVPVDELVAALDATEN